MPTGWDWWVVNVNVLVGTFNQEKGSISVIVRTDGWFAALVRTLLELVIP